MLTTAQAWRMIGEAFEAKAAHPELEVDPMQDIARSGLCSATSQLRATGRISPDMELAMDWRTEHEVSEQASRIGWTPSYLIPAPHMTGTEPAEVRAMLAYLFAEEAAA